MPALPLQEAYLALQSITVPERQRDCLQRLVTRLCSRGEVAMLCSLPFADACVRREHGRSGRAAVSLASTLQALSPASFPAVPVVTCCGRRLKHCMTCCIMCMACTRTKHDRAACAAGRASGPPLRHNR